MLEVARRVRILGALTASNASAERAELLREAERGRERAPRWEYGTPPDARPLLRWLTGIERGLRDERGPLVDLHLARARELALEARLMSAAGTDELGALAAERFDAGDPARTDTLARAWVAGAGDAPPDETATVRSDAADPRSLLARMRRELADRGLDFAVEVTGDLSALAATGERTIYVARGRDVTDRIARRTVLHEVHAHALPRARAARSPFAIFAAGTARGTDDQEGLALVYEDRAGFLDAARRAELGRRHLAVRAMREGATFVDVVRLLRREHGATPAEAVAVAERAFRGSHGEAPGLGRECVYIPSFLRVRERLARAPADEEVLAAGQVSVDAVDVLAFVVSP